MGNPALEWLRNAPITDPIDRRNAPVMQALLLFLGVSTPAAWIYQLIAFGLPRGGHAALGSAAAVTVACFASVYLIRKGRFRPAIILYLATLLVTQEITHLASGFRVLMMAQVDQILTLIVAALVLGRRALWLSFAALCVIALSGCIVDAIAAMREGGSVAFAFSNLPSVVMTYAVISLVLDRTVAALRESLAESDARGQELQREMAERERAQAQLVHAQKMEASGRLASGIAHDFGNILDVILGFAHQRHSVLDQGSPSEQADALAASLDGVEVAARRGTAITRKLLAFGRTEGSGIEVFDASQALLELSPMLRQLFPPSVHLELESGAPAPVRLNRGEFELMVLNIAANARDAMPDGGRFEVRVSRPSPQRVTVVLADNGHGMEQHVRDRVFEPFFSTKPADQGTGLGLSVIGELMAAAGGDIAVDSAPGRGTAFTIRLPLANATDAGASPHVPPG